MFKQQLFLIEGSYVCLQASQLALEVKNPLGNAGDKRDEVGSLGWEDPLEEGMATYSRILTWKIL